MSLELKIEELTKQVVLLTGVISNLSTVPATTAEEKEEVIPTQPAEVETSPEPAEVEKPKRKPRAKKTEEVSLADLKDLAKAAVERTDRDVVKACICKHAPKLAMVVPDEYPALAEELKAL